MSAMKTAKPFFFSPAILLNTKRYYNAAAMTKKKRTPIDEALRKAVADYPHSVRSLAISSGIPQPVLHRFLKDGRNLRIDNAEKVCAVLGLELTPTKQPPAKGKE